MDPKLLAFGPDARRAIQDALAQATRLIRPTLGPLGRTVLAQGRPGEPPRLLSSGLEVLQELEFRERLPDTILRMLREAARRLQSTVGDGVATSMILTEAIFSSTLKHIESGADPFGLIRELGRAAERATRAIENVAFAVDTPQAIRQIASSAAGFDAGIGSLFEGIVDRLGRGAAVIVEESTQIESTVKVVEGLQISGGYASAHLVNRPETAQVMMEDARVLVHEPRISDVAALAKLLERVRGPLLIFTSDIDADPLATLVANRLRGTAQACAVRVRSSEALEDLAAFCGATTVPGLTLDRIELDHLGGVKRAVVEAETTTLLKGRGDPRTLVERIRRELASPDLPVIDREALQDRAARLSGTLVQIFAGGASTHEMKHNQLRLRGAVNAVRSGIQGGAVPGAGAAWLHGVRALGNDRGSCILRDALAAPLAQILANSGRPPRPILSAILTRRDAAQGFDAIDGRIVDARKAGILDPLGVVRSGLSTALSLAGVFLGCDAIVTAAQRAPDVVIPPGIEQAETARRRMAQGR